MCIRDRRSFGEKPVASGFRRQAFDEVLQFIRVGRLRDAQAVSYTHLRAHETVLDLVCRLLLEKIKKKNNKQVSALDRK